MKVTDLRRKLAAALVAGGFAIGGADAAHAVPVFVGDPGFEDHVVDDVSGFAYGAADQAGDPDGFNNPSSAGGGASPWQALASTGNGIGGDNASWIFNSGYGAVNSGDQAAEVQGLFAQNLTATFAAGQSYVASVAASADGGDENIVVSLYDAGAVTFLPTSTPELILTAPSLVTATPVVTSGPYSDERFTFTVASLAGLVGKNIGIAVYAPDVSDQGPHIDDIRLDPIEDVVEDFFLFLEVNTTTGVGTIKNLTGEVINIDYYEVVSPGNALDPTDGSGWNSLQDQDLAGFPAGDGSGNGWEQAGGSDDGILSESYLTGNSAVADQQSIGLGALFDPGDPQDLVFRYGVVQGTTPLDADFDNDNDTDGNDFLEWQRGFPTIFDADNLADWKNEFGSSGGPSGPSSLVTSYVRYVSSVAGSTAVPEPSSVVLVSFGLSLVLARRRAEVTQQNVCNLVDSQRKITMNTSRFFFVPPGLALASALLFTTTLISTAHASTNDREYQMGDDASESASNGGTVAATFDSQGQLNMQQLHDLVASGSPVYRTVSGRPDGGIGLGIEFSGASQFLRSARLGLPETTASAIGGNFAGTLNYNRLNNRGFQFWVQPTAAAAQSLVIDTNQHGARINADGNFSLQYAGASFDSTHAVVSSTWYHVMVVRPNGAGDGARMYVDGLAVAAAAGGYDGSDTADLVVGANTAGDDGFDAGIGFTGGTKEFFSGIIDDLTMFVIGDNSIDDGPPLGQDWGDFDFATDNDFAAFTLSGVPGDIDNNGTFEEADKAAFIAGWMSQNLVNGIRVPDLSSHAAGDLNSDGVTDIQDLVIIQSLLPTAGLSAITSADLAAVPEPTTAMLLLLTVTTTLGAGAISNCRRR